MLHTPTITHRYSINEDQVPNTADLIAHLYQTKTQFVHLVTKTIMDTYGLDLVLLIEIKVHPLVSPSLVVREMNRPIRAEAVTIIKHTATLIKCKHQGTTIMNTTTIPLSSNQMSRHCKHRVIYCLPNRTYKLNCVTLFI